MRIAARFGLPAATGSQCSDRGYPAINLKPAVVTAGFRINSWVRTLAAVILEAREIHLENSLGRRGKKFRENKDSHYCPPAVPWLFSGAYYLLTPLTTRSYPAHNPLTSVASACHERVMSVFGE